MPWFTMTRTFDILDRVGQRFDAVATSRGRTARRGQCLSGQRRLQVRQTDGFADVVVHSRRQTLLPVALHRVGRHGNDVCVPPLRCAPPSFSRRPDDFRGLVTIHLGHLAIHEHGIVGKPFQRLQCLQAVAHGVGRVTELAQLAQGDALIDRVVLGYQDALPGGLGNGPPAAGEEPSPPRRQPPWTFGVGERAVSATLSRSAAGRVGFARLTVIPVSARTLAGGGFAERRSSSTSGVAAMSGSERIARASAKTVHARHLPVHDGDGVGLAGGCSLAQQSQEPPRRWAHCRCARTRKPPAGAGTAGQAALSSTTSTRVSGGSLGSRRLARRARAGLHQA